MTKDEALDLALEALELHGKQYPHMVKGYCLDAITAINQARSAPVLEGWKLVPMDPTREMWAAVNKLDDQMAAGNYDGKGCSIEQAWNCLLDAAPNPPAAQRPVAEPHKWVHATPWRGLTDEEMDELVNRFARYELARATENLLRSKNT